MLSEVDFLQKLLHTGTFKFILDEIKKFAVLRSVALLQHRDIWVGDTDASIHCMNDMMEACNAYDPPDITTLGQHNASAFFNIVDSDVTKYGNELVATCLINVKYNNKSNINLESMIGLLMQCIFTILEDKAKCIIFARIYSCY